MGGTVRSIKPQVFIDHNGSYPMFKQSHVRTRHTLTISHHSPVGDSQHLPAVRASVEPTAAASKGNWTPLAVSPLPSTVHMGLELQALATDRNI